jgi:hypothetical protein
MFAATKLARQAAACTSACVTAAKHLMRYLYKTKKEGLIYSPARHARFNDKYRDLMAKAERDIEDPVNEVVTWSDADHAGDCVTLRSTSGTVVTFLGTPFAWKCERQKLRAHDTCQAELQAASDSVKLLRGLGFLHFFEGDPEDEDFDHWQELPPIMVDNASAIHVARGKTVTKGTKHYLLRCKQVQDWGKSFLHVDSDRNLSDPLTKGLTAEKYVQLLDPSLPMAPSKPKRKSKNVTESSEDFEANFVDLGSFVEPDDMVYGRYI